MSKELFMAAHEQLIEEYLEAHPDASEDEAYEATADGAWDRMRDNIADRADWLKAKAKEAGEWPPKKEGGNV